MGKTWSMVKDITHYNGNHFLTLIDCGPTRFSSRRPLLRQLESVFFERVPHRAELLDDSNTAFSNRRFRQFLEEWGFLIRLPCTYVPVGNGIVERCHRTLKRIEARKQCRVIEAVYWYNVTSKDDMSALSAPANMVYSYKVRLKGIDTTCPPLLE